MSAYGRSDEGVPLLNYQISGPLEGPLVIACHGVTDSGACLADLVDRLNTGCRVAAVDTLGHGRSPRLGPDDHPRVFGACLDALEETAEHLVSIHGPALVIGHSMGGALGTALAARRPDLVTALIAEDPAWLTTEQAQHYRKFLPTEAARFAAMVGEETLALAANRRDYPNWPETERLPWLQGKFDVDPGILAAGVVGLENPWEDILPALQVPTLVVTSDGADILLGHAGLRRVASAANPLIETALLPGGSHCVRRDQPEAFHALISAYLNRWTTR